MVSFVRLVIVILLLAGVVLFIVLATVLPILEAGNAVQ